MKMNKRLYLILGLVCLLNLAAHLCFYPQMPEVIPIHWGSDGAVDGYGPRWMMLVLAVLPLACLALFALVPKMDPKGANYEKFRPLWQGFIIAITLLMAAVSWLTEAEVFGLSLIHISNRKPASRRPAAPPWMRPARTPAR